MGGGGHHAHGVLMSISLQYVSLRTGSEFDNTNKSYPRIKKGGLCEFNSLKLKQNYKCRCETFYERCVFVRNPAPVTSL